MKTKTATFSQQPKENATNTSLQNILPLMVVKKNAGVWDLSQL